MDSLRLLAKARNAVRMLENNECGLDKIQSEAAMRTLDYWMNGNTHFTELSARGCIAQMYYYIDDTRKRFGPFLDFEEVKGDFEKVRMEIPDYNVWDFAVTMNLVYSNHHEVIEKWTRKKENVVKRVSKLAVSFLNDEDSAHPSDKIFWYMMT